MTEDRNLEVLEGDAVDDSMDVFHWQQKPLTQEEIDEVTAELRF